MSQKFVSKAWDGVEDIIKTEMAFFDGKPNKHFKKTLEGVYILDEFTAIYGHQPSAGESAGSVYKGYNLGNFFKKRDDPRAADYKRKMLKRYEATYPPLEEFIQLFNYAHIEDYARTYGHMPNTDGCTHNGVDVGALWAQNAYRKNHSALSKDLASQFNDVKSHQEFLLTYNLACLEDFIYEHEHLPNIDGQEHKGVDVGLLCNKHRSNAERISEEYREELSRITKDVPLLSEKLAH